jgi:hypothetical protein
MRNFGIGGQASVIDEVTGIMEGKLVNAQLLCSSLQANDAYKMSHNVEGRHL